jgi:hypothetical protein
MERGLKTVFPGIQKGKLVMFSKILGWVTCYQSPSRTNITKSKRGKFGLSVRSIFVPSLLLSTSHHMSPCFI